jgi:hypothetical protein
MVWIMVGTDSSSGKPDQDDSDRNFMEWRKTWLVNQAEDRHIQDMQAKNRNVFWKWYAEKSKVLQRKYNHLYSDITARELREYEKGWRDIEKLKYDIDGIRQQFIRHDRDTILTMAGSLEKIGLEKEAGEFKSPGPMSAETIRTLDLFFDAMHENNFNDLQITEFYETLSSEERKNLGCKS